MADEDGLATYLVNKDQVHLSLDLDQSGNYVVYMDGKQVALGAGQAGDVWLMAEDGVHTVTVAAVNAQMDTTEVSFSLHVDTTAPVLRIDSPDQTSIVEDQVLLTGYVDQNSTLSVDGNPVTFDSEGLFSYPLSVGDTMSQTYEVIAKDEIGNESVYTGYLINHRMKDMVGIEVAPNPGVMAIGASQQYTVYAVDEDGHKFLIDNSLVNWRLLKAEGAFTLEGDGLLKANAKGSDVLIASLKISNDYAFEEAVIVSAGGADLFMTDIELNPNDINLTIGTSKTLATYAVNLDQTSLQLPEAELDYEVIVGRDVVTVNNLGMLTGVRTGTAVVKVTYTTANETYVDYGFVTVTKQPSEKKDKKLDESDEFILTILPDLIAAGVPRYTIDEMFISYVDNRAIVSMDYEAYTAYLDAAPTIGGKKNLILIADTQSDVLGYGFDMPKALLDYEDDFVITLVTAVGEMTFSRELLSSLLDEYEGEVVRLNFDIADQDVRNQFTTADRAMIGERPLYQYSFAVDGLVVDWHDDENPMFMCSYYVLDVDESSAMMVVIYVADDGSLSMIPSGKYNQGDKSLSFRAHHFSSYGVGVNAISFEDLNRHEWAREAVESLASKDIIRGTGQDQYSPGANISRAQILTLLVRALELKGEGTVLLPDVEEGSYYYEADSIASALGIDVGLDDGLFHPDDPITRDDLMILIDACLAQVAEVPSADVTVLGQFTDLEEVSEAAFLLVAKLVNLGIIKGLDHKIMPHSYTTRAEAAMIIYRLYYLLDNLQ